MYSPYGRRFRPRWRDGSHAAVLHAQRHGSFTGKTAHQRNWRLARRGTRGSGKREAAASCVGRPPQTRQPAFGESEMIPLEKVSSRRVCWFECHWPGAGVLCGFVMSMGCASPLVADPVASCSPRCSRAFAECVASGKQNQRHSRRVQARGTAEQHLPQRSSTANRDVWAAAGLRLQNLLSTVGCGASQTASTSFADIDEP